jgi:hypothetical protein
MTWQPQPGTVPFRALAWLRENSDGKPVSTAVICDALGVDSNGFSTSMKPAVKAGLVKGEQLRGFGHAYFWTLEAEPEQHAEDDEADDHAPASAADIVPRPGPLFPGVDTTGAVLPNGPGFRALLWEGQLLATGMEIRDGVAIFTPEHIDIIKRQVAWARPA